MLSYADGSDDLREAGARVLNQARHSNIFADCKVLGDLELRELVSNPEDYFDFIAKYPRGRGLWSWKSLLICKAVEGYFGDFDGIFYTDAGSELVLNVVSRRKLTHLMKRAMRIGVLGFTTNSTEIQYSKKMVLDMLVDPKEAFTLQREATTLLISTKSEEARSIVTAWRNLCFKDGFELLKDSHSAYENSEFIDHRHDQSILSILLKNAQIPGFKSNTPNHSQFPIPLLEKIIFTPWPIWQVRNRTGVSLLDAWQGNFVCSHLCVPFFAARNIIFRSRRTKNRIFFWYFKILKNWKQKYGA